MDGPTVNQFVYDVHICGSCQKRFSDLGDFVEHKKCCCKASILTEPSPGVGIYRDVRRTPDEGDGKFVQSAMELPAANAEIPVGVQLQQQQQTSATSGAAGMLMLPAPNITPEKVVVPSSDALDSQSSVLQIQTANGLQVLGNISIQDLQLLILATKQQQQQQLQQQLLQSHEQQLQAIVQQQLQPVLDVVETVDAKVDTVGYTVALPVLQFVETSRSLQDGEVQHEPGVKTEMLQQNLPGQVIQTILQPGLTGSQIEKQMKDDAIQQVLSVPDTITTTDTQNPSGSVSGSESISRVEIQIPSADPDLRAETSSFDEQHIATSTPTKPDCGRTSEKSSLRLRYGCTYKGCNYVTQYSKNVERHMLIHTGERPFVCTQCNSRFNRSDKLKNHQRIHTGDKPFKCSQCEYRCADISSLKKHKRIHTDERPFKCQICSYASRNSSQLTVHLRTHTGDKPFMCPECCATFKIKSDLKRHRRMHTGEKPYSCSLCDFRTAVNSNLKAHMKTYHCEENMMECKKCDFRTSSKRVFKTHMKMHTPEDQRLVCHKCSYICTNVRLMQTHIRTHSEERPFSCPSCRYVTKTRTCLNSHIRNRHPKEYGARLGRRQKRAQFEPPNISKRVSMIAKCMEKFKCDICGTGFVRADSLRSHLRSHQEKAAYDSAKKQKSQESAVTVLATPCASTAASTQPSNEEQLTYLWSNTYNVNQEHEYAAVTQHDLRGGSLVKSEAASNNLLGGGGGGVEVMSTQKETPCHDLQSLLPFIQNNHNTAVWENMQNLAALNQGEGHVGLGNHDQGHQNAGDQIQQSDIAEPSDNQERSETGNIKDSDHNLCANQDHGAEIPSSSCDVYDQQSVIQITVDHTIQAPDSAICAKSDCAQGHSGDQSLDVISFGTASTTHPLIGTEAQQTTTTSSQATILIPSSSQREEMDVSNPGVPDSLIMADGQGTPAHETPDHLLPNVLQHSEPEARCSTSIQSVNDVTDSNNITIFSAIKNTDDMLKVLSLQKGTIITVPYSTQLHQTDSTSQFVTESEETIVENNNSPEHHKSELPLIVQSIYKSTTSNSHTT